MTWYVAVVLIVVGIAGLTYLMKRAFAAQKNFDRILLPGTPGGTYYSQQVPLAPEIGLFAPYTPGGNYQGMNYTCHYFSRASSDRYGINRYVPFFEISFPFKSSGGFKVIKEKGLHAFLRKLDMTKETPTSDPGFDEKFHIESKFPEFSVGCFNSQAVRRAVDVIHSLGFTEVMHDGKILKAMWRNFRSAGSVEPSIVTEALDALIEISKNIPG